ncbi:MAG TPA: OmpA family protein [Desulfonatronum sp.]|nr:OmpA family protein [Desulfonatronum sp.]
MKPNILMIFCIVALIAACAPKTTVVLVPDHDGRVGQVVVSTPTDEFVLDQENQYVEVTDKISAAKEMDQHTMGELFGEALAVLPEQPASFLLYFETNAVAPDHASLELLPGILQTIKDWKAPQVSIIGHSDTAGDSVRNYKLSLERAGTVRELLEQGGILSDIMEVFAYGDHDPLVPTGPNISEPRNRRVEILIR